MGELDQGYQIFPLLIPGVDQNIALRAAPADRTSTYLVSAFSIHASSLSTHFANHTDNEMYLKR